MTYYGRKVHGVYPYVILMRKLPPILQDLGTNRVATCIQAGHHAVSDGRRIHRSHSDGLNGNEDRTKTNANWHRELA